MLIRAATKISKAHGVSPFVPHGLAVAQPPVSGWWRSGRVSFALPKLSELPKAPPHAHAAENARSGQESCCCYQSAARHSRKCPSGSMNANLVRFGSRGLTFPSGTPTEADAGVWRSTRAGRLRFPPSGRRLTGRAAGESLSDIARTYNVADTTCARRPMLLGDGHHRPVVGVTA